MLVSSTLWLPSNNLLGNDQFQVQKWNFTRSFNVILLLTSLFSLKSSFILSTFFWKRSSSCRFVEVCQHGNNFSCFVGEKWPEEPDCEDRETFTPGEEPDADQQQDGQDPHRNQNQMDFNVCEESTRRL